MKNDMETRTEKPFEEMSSYCMFCRGKNNLCTSSKMGTKPVEIVGSFNFVMRRLPENVLLHIFSFMGYRELLNARCVCNKWKRIAEDRQLWRSINMSCKRIQENNMLFRLPKRIYENVRVVNLMWTYISAPAFDCIKKVFKNVEVMLLQYCRFSIHVQNGDGSQREIVSLPYKLKILDVRNVQGSWFDGTGSITTLNHIEAMAFSQTMPPDWLSRLSMTWLPKLIILNIQNNPSLSDVFLKGVINNAPNLESICIQGCMYVRGIFLEEAIRKLPKLHTLDLSGTRLESRNIYSVPWKHSKLRNLNISFCCKIFEQDLEHILPKLQYLRQLQASFVGWGRAFSDEVVSQMLLQSNAQFVTLDIQSTFGMSIKSLVAICKQSPKLQHLRVGTIIKTKEDLTWLLSNIPNIRSLSLQMGESNFKAPHLFEVLSAKCTKLESLFIYNIGFDSEVQTELKLSLEALLTKCYRLRNFFTGGYPKKQKQTLESIAKTIMESLKLNLNCDRPVRIVPQPDISFDRYLCSSLSKRSYHATALRLTFEKSINCQSFYRTGLQKLEDRQFALLQT